MESNTFVRGRVNKFWSEVAQEAEINLSVLGLKKRENATRGGKPKGKKKSSAGPETYLKVSSSDPPQSDMSRLDLMQRKPETMIESSQQSSQTHANFSSRGEPKNSKRNRRKNSTRIYTHTTKNALLLQFIKNAGAPKLPSRQTVKKMKPDIVKVTRDDPNKSFSDPKLIGQGTSGKVCK